jgi:hypothetical protein
LIPGYKEADPLTRDAEFHKIASSINHQMIDRLLAQEPNGKRVVILAGGAGSGKTTASGIGRGAIPMDFAIDTVMGWDGAMIDLQARVTKSGRNASFIYVYTPFEKALPRVIDRYSDKNSDSRLVPLAAIVDGHIGAQQNILNASDDFFIGIIDNSGAPGQQRLIDKIKLQKYDYLREQGREEAGSTKGNRAHRPNHDRQHQPSSGGKGTEGARERARARLLAQGREILKQYQREGKLTQREVDAFLQEGEFATRKTEGE